jgi:hypothetical protein
VVDSGPFTTDGIYVTSSVTTNDRLNVTIPAEATLPYEVATEGGTSGRMTDIEVLDSQSASGTPLAAEEASANVGQTVTLQGQGYVEGVTKVTLEAMTTGALLLLKRLNLILLIRVAQH